MKKVKRLFFDTLILTATTFLMRTVGLFFGVYLTNRVGAEGMGLYHLVLSVYMLSCTIACGGVRLASTRLCAESIARGKSPVFVIRHCIFYSTGVSLTVAFLLYLNAGFIAERWLLNAQAAVPLKIFAASLPPYAISSAMGGYFAAARKAAVHSFIQVFEQGVRISVVVLTLPVLIIKGAAYASVSMAAAAVASETFTCLCLIAVYFRDKKGMTHRSGMEGIKNEMLNIAVPDLLGSGTRSVLSTTENMLIPEGFRRGGLSEGGALKMYGTVNAMALPIIYFPSAVLNVLSNLLVPELAQCRAQNKTNNISYIIRRVLRLSIIFSMAAAGIIYAYSAELSHAMYKSHDAALYLKILAPVIPVMYLDMVVDGMLKGLNLQFYSMCYNIIDAAARVVLVFFLIPLYSVWGYIAVLYISEVLNFYLSFGKLASLKYLKIKLFRSAAIPAVCIAAAIFATRILFWNFSLTVSILLALLIYFIFLIFTRSLTFEDLRWFKSIIK